MYLETHSTSFTVTERAEASPNRPRRSSAVEALPLRKLAALISWRGWTWLLQNLWCGCASECSLWSVFQPVTCLLSSILNEITRQVHEATQDIEQRLSIEIEQRLSNEIDQRLTGEIEQRLTGEMERMLNEKLMAHLERMGAQMTLLSLMEGQFTEQVPNVASRQPIIRASMGNGI